MSKTALIAGATGLVGRHLLMQLLADKRYSQVKVLTRRPLGLVHEKLQVLQGELDRPEKHGDALAADDVFCCLGTTMRQAGSKAAFEQVDYHMVVRLARAVHAQGARQFVVVSSLSANPRSPVYYSRVKGRMERALREVGFDVLHIIRPSLLLGEREDARGAEMLAQRLLPLLNPILRGRYAIYRAVPGSDVAAAMRTLASRGATGVQVHTLPLASG
jgi:uncharacterized protein YbjT (DUF2867 family)